MTPAEKVVAALRAMEDPCQCAGCSAARDRYNALADVVKAGSWCATFAPRAAQAEFDEAIRRAAEVCG